MTVAKAYASDINEIKALLSDPASSPDEMRKLFLQLFKHKDEVVKGLDFHIPGWVKKEAEKQFKKAQACEHQARESSKTAKTAPASTAQGGMNGASLTLHGGMSVVPSLAPQRQVSEQ